MQTEQRACARFPVTKNAYAALKIGTYKVGKVQNISMDGLMFYYIGLKVPASAYTEVDLFIPHNCVYIPKIPCIVVYSTVRRHVDSGLSFAPFMCGLSLRSENKIQRMNIKKLIGKSTK